MMLFSADTLAYLRAHEGRARAAAGAPVRVPLTQTLRAEIADGLGLVLPADLEDVPLRWIEGESQRHEDKTGSGDAFQRTYLAYVSEGATGTLFVEGAEAPVLIATNTGTSFVAGAEHWTEGATPRLVLGPMNERGESVGFNSPAIISVSADGNNLAVNAVDGDNANIYLYTSTDSGASWTYRKDISTNNYTWSCPVASSADGTHIIASAVWSMVGVWTSSDSGQTWVQTDLSSGLNWIAVACSANGSVLVACEYQADPSGCVWISRQGGAWVQQAQGPTLRYNGYYQRSIAINSAGTVIVVVADDGIYTGIYNTVTNTWDWTSDQGPEGVFNSSNANGYVSIALSSDGTVLLAATYEPVLLATFTTGSWSWSVITPSPPTTNWVSCAMDATGTNLVMCVYNGDIWRSSNSGGTWTQMNVDGGDLQWSNICSSADGSKIFAFTSQYDLFYGDVSSDNTTVTWKSIPYFAFQFREWSSLAITPNGQTLVAGLIGGDMFASSDSGYTWRDITVNGNPGNINYLSNIALSADGMSILVDTNSNNYDLLLSTDGGLTWTDLSNNGTPSGNWWASLAMDASGLNMLALDDTTGVLYASYDSGGSWNTTGMSFGTDGVSQQVAISGDGQTSIIGSYGSGPTPGHIVVGTFADGSYNWVDLLGGDGPSSGPYSSTTISANGQVMACCGWGQYIWLSSLRGAAGSWSSISWPSSWRSVALSADGKTLIACEHTGDIWLYNVRSGQWTNSTTGTPLSGNAWFDVVIADNILGAVSDNYTLYLSRDGGWSWHPAPIGPSPGPGPGPAKVLSVRLLNIA